MSITTARLTNEEASPHLALRSKRDSVATLLTNSEQGEVLRFLADRSVRNVFMAGLIRDNGVESPRNRGTFYGYRATSGRLTGVALVGHVILFDARDEEALAALAQAACHSSQPRLIRGEPDEIGRFWKLYRPRVKSPRLISRESLMEQRAPVLDPAPVPELRPASARHLDQVVAINSELFIQESGSSPLETNPDGFRQRLAHRINQSRIWITTKEEQIIFKADIVADTPEAIYLESIYVHPAERGKGYGSRCLTTLGANLLARTNAICLTVNEKRSDAVGFYRKLGFRPCAKYETFYF